MPRTANPALMKPLELDETLQAIVGAGPMSRGQITKSLWDYIKAHKLQKPGQGRTIIADDKLRAFFDGANEVDMLKLGGFVSKHVKK